jgi:hypothetical protein
MGASGLTSGAADIPSPLAPASCINGAGVGAEEVATGVRVAQAAQTLKAVASTHRTTRIPMLVSIAERPVLETLPR